MKSDWKIIGGILAVFLIFSGLRSLGLFGTKEVYIEKESKKLDEFWIHTEKYLKDKELINFFKKLVMKRSR